jgi:hypothetical protein
VQVDAAMRKEQTKNEQEVLLNQAKLTISNSNLISPDCPQILNLCLDIPVNWTSGDNSWLCVASANGGGI